MSEKILVVGATGNTGTYLVDQLVKRGERVKAASRTGKAVGAAEPTKFDLTDISSYAAAFEGVDRAFLVIPAGYLNNVSFLKTFIDYSAERRVKVVLQTAFGVGHDPNSPYRQAEIALERSLLPYVILRPNWFSDNFHTFWREGIRHGVIAISAADSKASFIDTRDIADCAVAALTSSKFDRGGYELTGPDSLSYTDAAAILSSALEKPVRYHAVSDAEFVAMLTKFGMPEDYALHLNELFAVAKRGLTAPVTQDVSKMTGKPARTLAQYARDNRDKFL